MTTTADPAADDEPQDGRCPPYDLAAEESLLGAMLLRPAAIEAALGVGLVFEDFFRLSHAYVFDAILKLYDEGEPADPVTVADVLRRRGRLDDVGGPDILTSLQIRTPATSAAGRYARIVTDLATLRRLIAASGKIADLAYGVPDDVLGAIQRARAMLSDEALRLARVCEGEARGAL